MMHINMIEYSYSVRIVVAGGVWNRESSPLPSVTIVKPGVPVEHYGQATRHQYGHGAWSDWEHGVLVARDQNHLQSLIAQAQEELVHRIGS